MTLLLDVRIPGEPVAKGRPRLSARGGRVFARTPNKTANWEQMAAGYIREAWSGDWAEQMVGSQIMNCPVRVEVEAIFPRPKTKVWKRKPMPAEWKTTRPDLDNVVKAALDACNQAEIWTDDSIVVSIHATKIIASGDELPHVQLQIYEEVQP